MQRNILDDNCISGTALIRGMIRELAILGVPVTFLSESGSQNTRILMTEEAQARSSKELYLRLEGIIANRSGSVVFALDHAQYQADLIPADGNVFQLPSRITRVQRRARHRSTIASLTTETVLVEMRGPGWRYWGRVRDHNAEHLVAELQVRGTYPMSVQDSVELRVYSPERQNLHTAAWISLIRSTVGNAVEIVFCLTTRKASRSIPRPARIAYIGNTSIKLCWPDEQGLEFSVVLLDLGFSGFSGRREFLDIELPPVGAVCKVVGTTLFARLVWMDESRMGFDLRANEKHKLEAWHFSTFGRTSNPLLGGPTVRRTQRLLSIFMRAGYLRSKRADPFVLEPDLHRLIPGLRGPVQWLRRYSGSENAETHVAFCRLSDCSWMIQEIANGGGTSGVGSQMVRDALIEFFTREQAFLTTHGTLVTLFDMGSRFNRSFWLTDRLPGRATVRTALVLDWTEFSKRYSSQHPGDIAVTTPEIFSWHTQFAALESFGKSLLLSLGVTEATFDSPELGEDLARSGYLSHRQIRILEDHHGPVAIAVSFGLPTLANATATANAIWLLTRNRLIVPDCLRTLACHDSGDPILLGATDIVVLAADETEPYSSELSGREFGFLCMPIVAIPTFLGVENV